MYYQSGERIYTLKGVTYKGDSLDVALVPIFTITEIDPIAALPLDEFLPTERPDKITDSSQIPFSTILPAGTSVPMLDGSSVILAKDLHLKDFDLAYFFGETGGVKYDTGKIAAMAHYDEGNDSNASLARDEARAEMLLNPNYDDYKDFHNGDSSEKGFDCRYLAQKTLMLWAVETGETIQNTLGDVCGWSGVFYGGQYYTVSHWRILASWYMLGTVSAPDPPTPCRPSGLNAFEHFPILTTGEHPFDMAMLNDYRHDKIDLYDTLLASVAPDRRKDSVYQDCNPTAICERIDPFQTVGSIYADTLLPTGFFAWDQNVTIGPNYYRRIRNIVATFPMRRRRGFRGKRESEVKGGFPPLPKPTFPIINLIEDVETTLDLGILPRITSSRGRRGRR